MIIGTGILLRAIEHNDLPLLVKWRNDPQVYSYFYEHEPLSLAMQQRWFEKFLHRNDEKFWIAETVQSSKPIGTVALVNIDLRSRKAELGRVLISDGENRCTGLGLEMCRLTIAYAFNHLNLNRVYLEVFADNLSAIKFYKKIGFSEEGLLRQHVFASGKYKDVLVFSLLRDELN